MEGSEQTVSKWQRWRTRLSNTYRLVIMNDDTFEEFGSYKLSLLNVYVFISSLLVVVTVLVVSLIAFTPLKQYIPGYGDVVQREALDDLQRELRRLEKDYQAQVVYTENFRRILLGEVDTMSQAEIKKQLAQAAVADTFTEVTLSEEEISLRREMELEAVGRTARSQNNKATAGSKDIPLEQMFFTSPARGEISKGFKPQEGHFGTDILAPKNTAIKAVLDGYVFMSDYTIETGNTIGIQHTNNVITFYKHNAELLKKAGSFVKAGEAIAIIGNTGTLSSGPHLHFEIWHKGLAVDPTEVIKF